MKKPLRWTVLLVLSITLLGCSSGPEMTDTQPPDDPGEPTELTEEPTQPGDAQATVSVCPQLSPHPVAANIAETFELEYELVVEWFCSGQPFDEILLAVQTAQITDAEVEALFEARAEGDSWEQIWEDLGVTAP